MFSSFETIEPWMKGQHKTYCYLFRQCHFCKIQCMYAGQGNYCNVIPLVIIVEQLNGLYVGVCSTLTINLLHFPRLLRLFPMIYMHQINTTVYKICMFTKSQIIIDGKYSASSTCIVV